MFDSTAPLGDELFMRVSEFQRRQAAAGRLTVSRSGATELAALTPSLVQDLLRFDRSHTPGAGLDMLEVLAAALRHNRALRLHLRLGDGVMPVTLWPQQREVQSPLRLDQLLALRLPDLQVLLIEPADPREQAAANNPPLWREPLGPLLWELALRGARDALLPEISGVAAYRVSPGADLAVLDLSGSLAAAVARLRRQTTPLREIAEWPGFDRERAMRMLNGLYLQAALMISRSHPAGLG